MSILIADDDEGSRLVLEQMLRKLGYAVWMAADGPEALAKMQAPDSPDIVLLDWMMPGLDGIEVCRSYRALHPEAPKYIIMLTARDSKSDTVEGLVAGVNDYIVKPFDTSELIARLNTGRRSVEMQKKIAAQEGELRELRKHIRQLQGLLPICMQCRKLRTDRTALERIAQYVSFHHGEVSGNICPDCLAKTQREGLPE